MPLMTIDKKIIIPETYRKRKNPPKEKEIAALNKYR